VGILVSDTRVAPDSLEALEQWNNFLYPDPAKPCICLSDYKGLGRFYGVDMGKGWVRVTTHPDCLHHGTQAERERWERHHPGKKYRKSKPALDSLEAEK